jgi:CRP-like cAMP-binding protein
VALHQSSLVRNRLLSALTRDDFALLEPMLERVPLTLHSKLVEAGQIIQHVVFPESGISSTIANTEEGKIEVGIIGREGLVGVPVILGANRTPHTYLIQADGEGLRISSQDLRAAIAERPSIFRPLGLYVQALIVQMGQTAYVNVTFNIEARLARWILMTQDRIESDELMLTHEFLSAMLGVRRPGVTAAMHVLEGMGSIRNRRGRVEVVNREKLMELAGDGYQTAEIEYDRLMGEA